MHSALAPLLVFVSVACTAFSPSAAAEPPPPPWSAPERVAMTPHVEIVDDDARPLATFALGARLFVLGAVGERYALRVVNPTPGRVEAVVSVDGLDAIDGGPASPTKRGYLVPAYGEVTIDGWRTSLATVAAFRFSPVRTSYAARIGRDRNVGVIGVAFFRERPVVVGPATAKASRARSAPSAAGATAPSAADESRPGLGTEFGESHDSYVTEVPFERAGQSPDRVSELRYDDHDGLVARGIRVPPRDPRQAENAWRDRAEPFPEARFAQPPR